MFNKQEEAGRRGFCIHHHAQLLCVCVCVRADYSRKVKSDTAVNNLRREQT